MLQYSALMYSISFTSSECIRFTGIHACLVWKCSLSLSIAFLFGQEKKKKILSKMVTETDTDICT